MLVVHLNHVVIDDGHMTYIQGIGIQETVEGLRIIKGLDLGLVGALSKLAPHGVEHEFSEGTQPRILLDVSVVQQDALLLVVVLNVRLFLFFCHVVLRPPTGFLFDFQPGVDVIGKEPLTGLGEMPDFIDVLDLVPQFDGFV